MEINKPALDRQNNSPEFQINFECNDSEITIGRMNNPVIRSQLIDMLMRVDVYREEKMRSIKVVPFRTSLDGNSEDDLFKDEVENTVYSRQELGFKARTREEIEKQVAEAVEEVTNSTVINYTSEEPSNESMSLGWKICS